MDDVGIFADGRLHLLGGVIDPFDKRLGLKLGSDGDNESHDDACDSGVNTARQHSGPQHDSHGSVGQRPAHAAKIERQKLNLSVAKYNNEGYASSIIKK